VGFFVPQLVFITWINQVFNQTSNMILLLARGRSIIPINKVYSNDYITQTDVMELDIFVGNDSVFMNTDNFHKFVRTNMNVIIPVVLTGIVIFVGGFGEYLAEYKQPGANITKFGDALWWSVITITTVGYGDYTPITPVGRIIGTIVMFAGIGIAVTLVTVIAQSRVDRMQERLKSRTASKAGVVANEIKSTIQDKVVGIEKLTH
jgi:hypothetical protein